METFGELVPDSFFDVWVWLERCRDGIYAVNALHCDLCDDLIARSHIVYIGPRNQYSSSQRK